MNFNWSDYLELAKELCKDTNNAISEAYDRTIISRSYYAAYNAAAKIIERRENISDWSLIPDSHKYVIDKFCQSSNDDEKEIGQTLLMLKKARKKSDYRDYYPSLNRNNAKLNYLLAQQAFDSIKAL